MASVRTVSVGGTNYLQVVQYKRVDGQPKVEIIKSFGRDSTESRLRAEQFVAEYDRFRKLALDRAKQKQTKDEINSFQNSALAIFGVVLGGAIIIAILNEVLGSKKG